MTSRNILEHPKRLFRYDLPVLNAQASLYIDGWRNGVSIIEDGWYLVEGVGPALNVCIVRGQQHSINDEPSCISDKNEMEWSHYGKLHRIGGPAKISIIRHWSYAFAYVWPTPIMNSMTKYKEKKEYYLYGKFLSFEEYMNDPLVLQHKLYSLKHL